MSMMEGKRFTCAACVILLIVLQLLVYFTIFKGEGVGWKMATKKAKANIPVYKHYSENRIYTIPGFNRSLSKSEYLDTQRILHRTNELLECAGCTYMLYSGSLIGAYRHLDIIPWDDDVDLFVDQSCMPEIKKCMTKFKDISLSIGPLRWKTFGHDGKPLHNDEHKKREYYSWKFPFIDIAFYKTSKDRKIIADIDPGYYKFTYKYQDVFPLCYRPFMGIMMPVPRRLKHIIDLTYDITNCTSASYVHKYEIRVTPKPAVQCKQLFQEHQFVTRTLESNGSVIEHLDDFSFEVESRCAE